jgi:hypothetical protein
MVHDKNTRALCRASNPKSLSIPFPRLYRCFPGTIVQIPLSLRILSPKVMFGFRDFVYLRVFCFFALHGMVFRGAQVRHKVSNKSCLLFLDFLSAAIWVFRFDAKQKFS